MYIRYSNNATLMMGAKIYEYTTDGIDRNIDASNNGGGSVPHYNITFDTNTLF